MPGWILAIIVLSIVAVLAWWFLDDYIQRPMSYWSRQQLDAAFVRHPTELAEYVNRGSLSRAEWHAAIRRRNIETDSELARRGIKR